MKLFRLLLVAACLISIGDLKARTAKLQANRI